jgi:hypothetical protein
MPVNLIDCTDSKEKDLGGLCEDKWEIPEQIEALEKWLKDNKDKIKPGKFIADIGYCPREGAFGGGAVLTTEAMQIMVKISMDLYLSEYPISEDE